MQSTSSRTPQAAVGLAMLMAGATVSTELSRIAGARVGSVVWCVVFLLCASPGFAYLDYRRKGALSLASVLAAVVTVASFWMILWLIEKFRPANAALDTLMDSPFGSSAILIGCAGISSLLVARSSGLPERVRQKLGSSAVVEYPTGVTGATRSSRWPRWPRVVVGLVYLALVASFFSVTTGCNFLLVFPAVVGTAVLCSIVALLWITLWATREGSRFGQFTVGSLLFLTTFVAILLSTVRWLMVRSTEEWGWHDDVNRFLVLTLIVLVLSYISIPFVLGITDALLWAFVSLIRQPSVRRCLALRKGRKGSKPGRGQFSQLGHEAGSHEAGSDLNYTL